MHYVNYNGETDADDIVKEILLARSESLLADDFAADWTFEDKERMRIYGERCLP